jgi:hypothetical protein
MAYCDRCDRRFLRNWALEQHKENSDAHWPCDDCDLDFESYYAREEHYSQSPNHYHCNECELLFNSEGSKIQHMEAKHWYCRVHDKVSNSTATIIILHGRLRRTDAVVHCRSSSPKPACNRTTNTASITTSAKSVGAILMMRMSCGIMQRRITMPVGNAKRSVALFAPPKPDK